MFKKLFDLKNNLTEAGASATVQGKAVKYPGVRDAIDGNTAVIMVEREASDAAGAYPITPSTQMGEYWAEAVAAGHLNTAGRPLIFVEPESEHAAAGVTAGMSMSGLRAVNFTSAQGVAFMHESLYAAVGKRLPYVLNMGCRAITKSTLNVHCAHDDFHCVDDTGFIQLFAKDAQAAENLLKLRIQTLAQLAKQQARRIEELQGELRAATEKVQAGGGCGIGGASSAAGVARDTSAPARVAAPTPPSETRIRIRRRRPSWASTSSSRCTTIAAPRGSGSGAISSRRW